MTGEIDRLNEIVKLTPLHECNVKLQRKSVALRQVMSSFPFYMMDILLRAAYDAMRLTLHEVMKYCRLLY